MVGGREERRAAPARVSLSVSSMTEGVVRMEDVGEETSDTSE